MLVLCEETVERSTCRLVYDLTNNKKLIQEKGKKELTCEILDNDNMSITIFFQIKDYFIIPDVEVKEATRWLKGEPSEFNLY